MQELEKCLSRLNGSVVFFCSLILFMQEEEDLCKSPLQSVLLQVLENSLILLITNSCDTRYFEVCKTT